MIVEPRPTGWRLWLTAARPRTLTIAVAPLPPAAALAWSQSHALQWAPLAAALVAAIAIQAGTNLWNDVADAERGADTAQRQGPARVTAMGWASPAQVRRAALACFGVAGLVGIYLSWLGGWPILALGVAALLAGWAYSCGPRPIAYTAWGEGFVVLFFGIAAVAGIGWLQAASVLPGVIPLGIAMGLPAAAVLMVNNTRDIAADTLAGRRTLAIRLGAERCWLAYGVMVLAPFALLALVPGGWLGLLAAPQALRLTHAFAIRPDFKSLLGQTARLQMLLAVSAAVGVGLAL